MLTGRVLAAAQEAEDDLDLRLLRSIFVFKIRRMTPQDHGCLRRATTALRITLSTAGLLCEPRNQVPYDCRDVANELVSHTVQTGVIPLRLSRAFIFRFLVDKHLMDERLVENL
jgi:hypothetical protein